jgi:thiol-disulfide isomerase/thioredoxin
MCQNCLPKSSALLLLRLAAGKAIAPIYEQLSKQYPAVKFLKVDIDNEGLMQVVQEHGITGVVS